MGDEDLIKVRKTLKGVQGVEFATHGVVQEPVTSHRR